MYLKSRMISFAINTQCTAEAALLAIDHAKAQMLSILNLLVLQ